MRYVFQLRGLCSREQKAVFWLSNMAPHGSATKRPPGGVHEQALANAQRAVTLDPNDSEGFIALAHVFLHDGRPDEAAEAVETAMRLDPHNLQQALTQVSSA